MNLSRTTYVKLTTHANFEAAHYLPNYSGKCKNLHGHNWKVELCLHGPIDSKTGMLLDFAFVKQELKDLIMPYDHILLNYKIQYPTAENIAYRLMRDLNLGKSPLYHWCEYIRVYENDQCHITLTKEDYDESRQS